jgi:tripartite-type tricarboxylate transporter receptor subunit TctC
VTENSIRPGEQCFLESGVNGAPFATQETAVNHDISRRIFISSVAAGSFTLAHAQGDSAGARPIRVIVPFGPGGGSDPPARFFGARLAEALRQPVVVENRAGGISGSIGTMAVKSAPADGHTLLVASLSPMVINPIVVRDLPYDPLKDFKPVAGLTRTTNAVVVPANSPYQDLDALVKASRANSHLNAGGSSALFQLGAAWFASLAGFKFTYAPYKSVGQVLTDVGGGSLDWAFVDLGGALPLAKAGRIRVLGTTGAERHRSLPEVPTVLESGWKDFVFHSWITFHVRSETPPEATQRLVDAMRPIVLSDAAREFAQRADAELFPLRPEELLRHQREEFLRFQRVAEAAGIKAQ